MTGPGGKISRQIERSIGAIWTLVPCVITSVDRANLRVNVVPKVFGQSEYPVIEDVPIVFPKGGDSIILLPYKIGDVVLCGFSKFAMGEILEDHVVRPDSGLEYRKRFSYDDAFVIGGFATDIEIDDEGWELPAGDIVIYDPDKVEIGDVLGLRDRGSSPGSPENGMIWRDGAIIWGKSEGVTSKWGSGGGGTGELPTYEQPDEPSLSDNTQAVWKDTDTGVVWLVINVSGSQYKVEAT